MDKDKTNEEGLEDVPTFYYQYFHTADTGKMLGVHRATVWRWIESKKIKSSSTPQGYAIISLEEINRVRRKKGLEDITDEDIEFFWKWGKLPSQKRPS